MATLATFFNKGNVAASRVTERAEVRAEDPCALRALPNEDIYFHVKHIDNSAVIRQTDPAQERASFKMIAAAGLAAIFNAPVTGELFVLEVILRDFSLRTFTPIMVASVLGVAVTQALQAQDAQAQVQVELSSGQVTVHTRLSREAISAAIADEGYRVAA